MCKSGVRLVETEIEIERERQRQRQKVSRTEGRREKRELQKISALGTHRQQVGEKFSERERKVARYD